MTGRSSFPAGPALLGTSTASKVALAWKRANLAGGLLNRAETLVTGHDSDALRAEARALLTAVRDDVSLLATVPEATTGELSAAIDATLARIPRR